MLRPLFLTRATIGLAATAVEGAVALPGRAVEAVSALPGVPVRLAGSLVQSYLHAGQQLTELAVKGDKVIASVFPARADQPQWATFDEDFTHGPAPSKTAPATGGRGHRAVDETDVPTGRITPRDA